MRLFTATLATETNTFSPVPTDMHAFKAAFYAGPGEHPDTPTLCSSVVPILRRRGRAEGFTVIEGTSCWAEPAGLIQRRTYETLRDRILGELQAALPVDGVVLGLHGAMVAQGYDDPEGDFLSRVRAIVGPDVLVAAEFDPHSHLTALRVANLDILAAFRPFERLADPIDLGPWAGTIAAVEVDLERPPGQVVVTLAPDEWARRYQVLFDYQQDQLLRLLRATGTTPTALASARELVCQVEGHGRLVLLRPAA